MTKKKQMTEKELDQVSGGPAFVKFGDMTDRHNNLQESCANGTFFRGFSVGPVNRYDPDQQGITDKERAY